jgi:hypothetical protein
MPSIPAAALACRDGGAWRAARALLHGLAVAVPAAAWLHPGLAWVGLPLAALSWWRMAPPAPPLLAWDGQTWRLDGRPGRVSVALDLGGWMLLHFVPDPDPAAPGERRHDVWLPLSDAAGGWAPLRVALFASASRAAAGAAVAP